MINLDLTFLLFKSLIGSIYLLGKSTGISFWIVNCFTNQKLAYIHENPVRSGLVEKADDWLYSSQRNYSALEGLIEIDIADL